MCNIIELFVLKIDLNAERDPEVTKFFIIIFLDGKIELVSYFFKLTMKIEKYPNSIIFHQSPITSCSCKES